MPTLREQLKTLQAQGVTFSTCVAVFGEATASNAFGRAAQEFYANDELEFDQQTVVSESDEGAFVLGWRWITNEEAGISGDDEREPELEDEETETEA